MNYIYELIGYFDTITRIDNLESKYFKGTFSDVDFEIIMFPKQILQPYSIAELPDECLLGFYVTQVEDCVDIKEPFPYYLKPVVKDLSDVICLNRVSDKIKLAIINSFDAYYKSNVAFDISRQFNQFKNDIRKNKIDYKI